jgi:hypothetical protein
MRANRKAYKQHDRSVDHHRRLGTYHITSPLRGRFCRHFDSLATSKDLRPGTGSRSGHCTDGCTLASSGNRSNERPQDCAAANHFSVRLFAPTPPCAFCSKIGCATTYRRFPP